MKDYVQIIAVFVAVLIIIPCVSYAKQKTAASARLSSDEPAVRVLFEETGEVTEYSMHDYIVGAVFAQMPADFEEEALKAQAVLAATYAQRRIASEKESSDSSLKGADISDDTSRFQAFFTEEQAKKLYGGDYEKAYEKISAAADYAQSLRLTYDGEPILVAFHGISYGSTESAIKMWNEDIPYLQAVSSEWDTELEQCETSVSFTKAEMKAALSGEFGDCDLSGEPQDWISVAERTSGGTALKVSVGGKVCDSERFCNLLGIASQHFELSYEDGKFTFVTLGCGHLVGMSQYGADRMAKDGASCEEILLHYFPNTVLISS